MNKKICIFISIIVFIFIIVTVISPETYVIAFSNGLIVWATVLLPTIFPFLFFTKLLTNLGIIETLTQKFTFTQKLFKSPPISSYAFFISTLSGYPVGAKVVSDLYTRNMITKQEAIKMTTFTSNSGPMFIYGTVGIGLLFSKTLGIILLFSHIFGAILNGILYRNYQEKKLSFKSQIKSVETNNFSLADTMWDSILSILIIGGFVCIFFVVIEISINLKIFYPFAIFLQQITSIDSQVFMGIFNGILEITHGCLDITSVIQNTNISAIICSGIISFGGIATMLQAYAFLQKIGIKISFFIKQKLTHTFFSVIITAILVFIFF